MKEIKSIYIDKKYFYSLLWIDDNIPKQKLEYEIIEIDVYNSHILYNHTFYQFVDKTNLSKLANQKKEILQNLKTFFGYLSKK
jgi:hypothetical protein